MPRPCQELHAKPQPATCQACARLFDLGPTGEFYRAVWGESVPGPQAPRARPCVFLGEVLERPAICARTWVRSCAVHGSCTTGENGRGLPSCRSCKEYEADD